ncbi:ZIP family metal transporter [Mucilaginibacter sp. E4BP6]|uniref:ZIP family metal transporter n=1 Tax=Mucilaginibacter sp. E4BP6 TaxID=2723089 RepID=UPI0015CB37A3|nr:ZIP family metal transporter [Mucilaginibacter sp. E4BP6]NYE64958.1 ZIP family zinc transporter [Mucilaginibacter sp. E4BP6]
MITLIAIGTFITTIAGGLFALKFKNKLFLILGFSAGTVMGVAFFDLLPTAFELSAGKYGIRMISSLVAVGFLFYMIVDRLVSRESLKSKDGKLTLRGSVAAFSLTMHSLLDGITIGLAFQISTSVGAFVALAVLVHDFADGINTINVVLKENGQRRFAVRWLLLNGIAPVAGACSTFFYHLPQETLGILLAFVAGFFIYIGASDFIPDSHKKSPGLLTSVLTVVGFAVIYCAVNFSGI